MLTGRDLDRGGVPFRVTHDLSGADGNLAIPLQNKTISNPQQQFATYDQIIVLGFACQWEASDASSVSLNSVTNSVTETLYQMRTAAAGVGGDVVTPTFLPLAGSDYIAGTDPGTLAVAKTGTITAGTLLVWGIFSEGDMGSAYTETVGPATHTK